MSDGKSPIDPKGLIYEAFRIEGITASECRSVFLDWALSLPSDQDTNSALGKLSDQYAKDVPDHPMSLVLEQGMTTITAPPKRRGGWRSRTRN